MPTLDWEHLGIPKEKLENVAGYKDVWVYYLDLLPPNPTTNNQKKKERDLKVLFDLNALADKLSCIALS